MKRFDICIRPAVAALALGGQSAPRRGGDKATARDHHGRLVIPASALRGALRIELERLLRGRDGDLKACSANRDEEANPDQPCNCPVCRLFGESGSATGTLRVEDAVLAEDPEGPEPTVVRPRVAVSRRTRTAADKLLGFMETTHLLQRERELRAPARLVARGPLDSPDDLDEDYRNLSAACSALRAIGGGRARGFGWVDCSVEERTEKPVQSKARSRECRNSALELRFEALAPLHFGQGRPIGFFQPSLRHAPGSAVRGAIAFALLEEGLCTAEDARFQELFGPATQVAFGSARLAGDVPSATRRKCRRNEHVFDDLVGELLRREAATRGMALALRPESACRVPGCGADKLVPSPYCDGAPRPLARVRTRTALNRRTGTSMDRKLYSVEAIEPATAKGEKGGEQPLILTAQVTGLGAAGAELLAKLDGRELWLGGKRSKGMGRCRLHLAEARQNGRREAEAAVAGMTAALETGWEALRSVVGQGWPERWLEAGEVPLAIVLVEPWCPRRPDESSRIELAAGPLLIGRGGPAGVRPLNAFLEISEEGRFGANESRRYGAPVERSGEVPPLEVAAAGSTYVYAVTGEALATRLDEWIQLGMQGQGLHRDIGWGRFVLRGPKF